MFVVEAAELIAPEAAELAAKEAAELAAHRVEVEALLLEGEARTSLIRFALGDDGSNARRRPN